MAKKVIQVPVDAELLAALDQLSIPKSRLRQRIAALPPAKMTAVAKAIIFALNPRICCEFIRAGPIAC